MVERRRKTIRVHQQAVEMFEHVKQHLAENPRDGVLFLLDYEEALRSLGYDLSAGMREHLARQFPPTNPEKKALYCRLCNGEQFPIDLRLDLPLKPGPFAEGEKPVRTVAAAAPQEAAAANAHSLSRANPAGYSVLLQLSNDLINRALSTAYDSNTFRHHWADQDSWHWDELAIDLQISYSLDLAKPTVDFNTDVPEGIAFTLAVSGTITLAAEIWQLLYPQQQEYQQTIPTQVNANVSAIATAQIGPNPDQAGQSAVFLSLANITNIWATLSDASLPTDLAKFLAALITRIVHVELGRQGTIPLTFGFESLKRSGVNITRITTHILPPAGGAPGSLSIGIDTFSPPRGNILKISNIIPSGSSYGMVVIQSFLIGQVWPEQKAAQFPIDAGSGISIHDPELQMREGELWFQVQATKDMGSCLPDVNATGTVDLGFHAYQVNQIWQTQLNPLHDPDIDVDFWDQVFYSAIALLLGDVVGLGPILMIVLNIIIAILEGWASAKVTDRVRGFSVGFSEKIPGTNITASASTPVQPEIHADQIYGYGDAVFTSGT